MLNITMKYKKLIVNIKPKEMEIIDEACELDKRTRASLARKAMLKEARGILKNEVKYAR
jgi:uncharacterized protein (DUF1778 family)